MSDPNRGSRPPSALMGTAAIRLFAPVSYPTVRTAQFVQIAHVEAMPLAAWFPVVWRRELAEFELVIMRTVLSNGEAQPPGSPTTPASLPLVFRAYPFCLNTVADGVTSITLVQEFPDEPTDIGAPITTKSGQLGRGAEQRCRALSLFGTALAETKAMTAFLESRDLLVPWSFDLEEKDPGLLVSKLFVVRPEAFSAADLNEFVFHFGSKGAIFLTAHRLSLFRLGALLAVYRSKFRNAAESLKK